LVIHFDLLGNGWGIIPPLFYYLSSAKTRKTLEKNDSGCNIGWLSRVLLCSVQLFGSLAIDGGFNAKSRRLALKILPEKMHRRAGSCQIWQDLT